MPKIEPCNDHELEIARSIDQLAAKGPLGSDAICRALESLDFMVCHEDCRFLACYVHFARMNPSSSLGRGQSLPHGHDSVSSSFSGPDCEGSDKHLVA